MYKSFLCSTHLTSAFFLTWDSSPEIVDKAYQEVDGLEPQVPEGEVLPGPAKLVQAQVRVTVEVLLRNLESIFLNYQLGTDLFEDSPLQ